MKFTTKDNERFRDHRDLPLDLCEIKFASSKDAVRFSGYASVWNRVDTYGDVIASGAFKEALSKRRPAMLYSHMRSMVPGKFVEVAEDTKGLAVQGELTPGHSVAKDLEASMKHGAISGLSIGGYTQKSDSGENGTRIIKAFDLFEISVVAMPAEQEARIDAASIKSMLDECATVAEMEYLLREAAGFSKSMATAFVARLQRISRGEPEREEADHKSVTDLLETIRGATAELPNLFTR